MRTLNERMADNEKRDEKTLADHARDIVRGILEVIEDVIAPAPVLVPVRVRNPRRR